VPEHPTLQALCGGLAERRDLTQPIVAQQRRKPIDGPRSQRHVLEMRRGELATFAVSNWHSGFCDSGNAEFHRRLHEHALYQ
jgi:hypothetical protein